MEKTSIIIPSRNESLLSATVEGLINNAYGEIEIIIIADGPSNFPIPENTNVIKVIYNEVPEGLTAAIDTGISVSTGKYILRSDAHCLFSQGYDKILQENCEDNWVVTLRRYYASVMDNTMKALTNPVNPKIEIADYFYVSCPWTHPKYAPSMIISPWFKKTREKKDVLIDEQMTMQGCVWFSPTKYCRENLSNLSSSNRSTGEAHTISLRTWLGGGKVMINKNVWYAHPGSKTFSGYRGYKLKFNEAVGHNREESIFWINNNWDKRIHDFEWYIDHFWPLPLESTIAWGEKYWWPEDWKKFIN